MARLKYCNCPFPIPPRILLYKSLLPRMACIFFLSEYLTIFPPWSVIGMGYFFFILVTLHLCLLLIHHYLWNSQKWQILISVNRDLDFFIFWDSWPEKIDQLIFRNAKEIYFNEKFPIL
jgi:hypothetical protein